MEWDVVLTTLRLAGVTTAIAVACAIPLAWWIARSGSFISGLVATIASLPVVLPPSVLGFYILMALGPDGPIGRITQFLGMDTLAFTFWGLVLALAIYTFPYVLSPIQDAFESLDPRALEVAATLGAAPFDSFCTVVVPQAWRGLVSGIALGFTHTIGAFGIALMVGGSIPGRTRLMSTAIYEHVETLEYAKAHHLSLLLILFSFAVLLGVNGARGGLRFRRKKNRMYQNAYGTVRV